MQQPFVSMPQVAGTVEALANLGDVRAAINGTSRTSSTRGVTLRCLP
jgi:hypothetical protein